MVRLSVFNSYFFIACSARHVRTGVRMTSFHHRIAYPSFHLVVTFVLFGGRHLGRGREGRRALVLRWHSAALARGFAAAEQDSHRHEIGTYQSQACQCTVEDWRSTRATRRACVAYEESGTTRIPGEGGARNIALGLGLGTGAPR